MSFNSPPNESILYRLEDTLRRIDNLNAKCEENMKRLNIMIQEVKGLTVLIRPQVKKSGWYGEEIEVEEAKNILEIK